MYGRVSIRMTLLSAAIRWPRHHTINVSSWQGSTDQNEKLLISAQSTKRLQNTTAQPVLLRQALLGSRFLHGLHLRQYRYIWRDLHGSIQTAMVVYTVMTWSLAGSSHYNSISKCSTRDLCGSILHTQGGRGGAAQGICSHNPPVYNDMHWCWIFGCFRMRHYKVFSTP